jgi:prolyl-tRNA synthetase
VVRAATSRSTLVRRDTGTKACVPVGNATGRARQLLDEIQHRLLQEARAFRAAHTLDWPKTYTAMREFLTSGEGFVNALWCGSTDCEARVKAETTATIRCLPLDVETSRDRCIVCKAAAATTATWAQSY